MKEVVDTATSFSSKLSECWLPFHRPLMHRSAEMYSVFHKNLTRQLPLKCVRPVG